MLADEIVKVQTPGSPPMGELRLNNTASDVNGQLPIGTRPKKGHSGKAKVCSDTSLASTFLNRVLLVRSFQVR